ncbi:MAG: hypothetical protein FWD68_02715 [Alphaproteobacteria bacterium]|nr:hypothetical protein [Alphaproteobacteria bacterium]
MTKQGRVALVLVALFAAFAAGGGRCRAGGPRHPGDWPCAQARVPEISLVAVWAGPSLDQAPQQWREDPKVKSLVSLLAARRLALEDAEKQAHEFIAGAGPEKVYKAKLLFAGLFETLNAQRSSVMRGLERVGRKQREAVEKIRIDMQEQRKAQQETSANDAPGLEALNNQLAWEIRIFEERGKVVRFVCEVPGLIDQRLFALGRVIGQEINQGE